MDRLLITAKNLNAHIAGKTVLRDINLSIERGEIVTVVGPNGSGKTSLLKVLIGAVQPTTGNLRKSPELRIGYVPQRLHVEAMLPMTVARFLNLPRKKSASDIADALKHAGVPGIEKQQILGLSGGQFQRILLARAMLDRPNLLLLDEATAGLDQSGIADFYRHIENIRRKTQCAVLLVSHDLNIVMRQTDRVICLNTHICCEGKPEYVSASQAYKSLFGIEHGLGEDQLALYHHHHHHHHHTQEIVDSQEANRAG